MKKLFAMAAVLAAILFTSCAPKADVNGWYSDFEAAKKLAASTKRNVLLFVSSMKDPEENLPGVQAIVSKNFTDAVSDRYVCVFFDFNNLDELFGNVDEELTSKQQKEIENRRAMLQPQFYVADLYGFQSTPVIALISSEGYFIEAVQTEYSSESFAGYVGLVSLEDETVAEFNKSVAATKKGSVDERLSAIEKLYNSTSEFHRFAMSDLLKKAISLDKANKNEKNGDYLFQIVSSEAYKKITAGDNAGAIKLFEKNIDDAYFNAEHRQTIYYMIASLFGQGELDKVVAYLDKAIEAAPESENAEGIKSTRDGLAQVLAEVEAMKELAAKQEVAEEGPAAAPEAEKSAE